MTSIFVHGVSSFAKHGTDALFLDENDLDAITSIDQSLQHPAKSCADSQQVSVDALIVCIADKLHISSDSFHVQHDRRLLAPHQSLSLTSSSFSPASSLLYLRIIPRAALVGGKGGFGSLLRASTTKVGAKKTSNFSASRDLSGRRMRHVEAEQKIAEWNSQPHETLTAAQMQAKYKAIKEGRPTVVPQCKFGADCKYKFTTCRKDHPVDHEAEAAAAAAAKRAPSMSDFIGEESEEGLKPVSKRSMNDAVLQGLAGNKRGRSGEEQYGYEKKTEDEEDDEQEDLEELQYEDDFSIAEEADDDDQSPKKKNDNDRPNKRQHLDYLPSAVPALDDIIASSSSSSSSSSSRPPSMHDLISSPPAAAAAHKFFASSSSSASSTPIFPAFSQRAPQLQDVAPEKAAQGLAAVLAKVKNKAAASTSASSSSSSSTAPPAAAAAASFIAIDLASIESIDALTKFEAAHLSAELARVGLKAGGTPQQRAERLFLLKATPLDQIDAKHRAKK